MSLRFCQHGMQIGAAPANCRCARCRSGHSELRPQRRSARAGPRDHRGGVARRRSPPSPKPRTRDVTMVPALEWPSSDLGVTVPAQDGRRNAPGALPAGRDDWVAVAQAPALRRRRGAAREVEPVHRGAPLQPKAVPGAQGCLCHACGHEIAHCQSSCRMGSGPSILYISALLPTVGIAQLQSISRIEAVGPARWDRRVWSLRHLKFLPREHKPKECPTDRHKTTSRYNAGLPCKVQLQKTIPKVGASNAIFATNPLSYVQWEFPPTLQEPTEPMSCPGRKLKDTAPTRAVHLSTDVLKTEGPCNANEKSNSPPSNPKDTVKLL